MVSVIQFFILYIWSDENNVNLYFMKLLSLNVPTISYPFESEYNYYPAVVTIILSSINYAAKITSLVDVCPLVNGIDVP